MQEYTMDRKLYEEVRQIHGVKSKIKQFYMVLNNILDELAPFKWKTVVRRPDCEWNNPEIRCAKGVRLRKECGFRKFGLEVNRQIYQEA